MGADNERRVRSDRRVRDIGPPNGWSERRKQAERRLTVAEEAELSPEEFVRYFGAVANGATAKIAANTDSQVDLAAEVLDRVRDRF